MDNYQLWVPIEPLPKDLCFVKITHDLEVLTVYLRELDDMDSVLEIKFRGVLGYRVVHEGARSKTIDEIPSYRGFACSTDSSLLRWFHEESDSIFDDFNLIHYVICNIDNIIDVIGGPPITVRWIKGSSI